MQRETSADETETEFPRNTKYLGIGENIRIFTWRPSMVDPSRSYSYNMLHAVGKAFIRTMDVHQALTCWGFLYAPILNSRDILRRSRKLLSYYELVSRGQDVCTGERADFQRRLGLGSHLAILNDGGCLTGSQRVLFGIHSLEFPRFRSFSNHCKASSLTVNMLVHARPFGKESWG